MTPDKPFDPIEAERVAERIMRPYRVEVIADSSGKWAGNGMRYTTVDEAKREAINLANRWLAVREWRVVNESGEVFANA